MECDIVFKPNVFVRHCCLCSIAEKYEENEGLVSENCSQCGLLPITLLFQLKLILSLASLDVWPLVHPSVQLRWVESGATAEHNVLIQYLVAEAHNKSQ